MAKVERVLGIAKDGRKIVEVVDTKNIISKENLQQFGNEKRMKELGRRGYSPGQIAGMMKSKKGGFSEREIEKAIRNPNIKLDGRL